MGMKHRGHMCRRYQQPFLRSSPSLSPLLNECRTPSFPPLLMTPRLIPFCLTPHISHPGFHNLHPPPSPSLIPPTHTRISPPPLTYHTHTSSPSPPTYPHLTPLRSTPSPYSSSFLPLCSPCRPSHSPLPHHCLTPNDLSIALGASGGETKRGWEEEVCT